MNSDYDIESTEHLLQELKKIKLNPKALPSRSSIHPTIPFSRSPIT